MNNNNEEITGLRDEIESLKRETQEKDTKIQDLTRKADEMKDKFDNHRHTGSDNSLPLREDIILDKERGVQIGNSGLSGLTIDRKDKNNPHFPFPLHEKDYTVLLTGRDKGKGIVEESVNSQITIEHQPNLDETFLYGFRPPLYFGMNVDIVNGGSTLTQGKYKWEVNEFIGYLGTPAVVNVWDSNGVFRQAKVIASNTASTITITGTWNFTDNNCTFMVWKPIYFGASTYVWKRLYTAPDESGGIRFGFGKTVTSAGDADNGLLYMKGTDGKLYWRGTDGVITGFWTDINSNLIPAEDGVCSLGSDEKKWEWVRVKAVSVQNDIYAGGSQGITQTISVRKGDDSGACTITIKNGIIIGTTC